MSFSTELRPLGKVETAIEELHHLSEGQTTGYGGIWKSKRESTLAIIPVGRVHGLRVVGQPDRSRAIDCIRGMVQELRNLLKRPVTTVRIGGKSCPVVGAVGSLHCAVDVTGLDCQVGQKVTLNVNPMYLKNMEVQFR
jgi:alanine racemase